MVKISIIVPVYNSSKYLEKCFDSIRNQTYTDFEVIVINDGSTDCSGEICDKYATLDNRFKIIHKENGGVSQARNIGIDNAHGEYITFIDSDDWIDVDYLQKFIVAVDPNCDLIVSGIVCNYSNGSLKILNIENNSFLSNNAYKLHQLIKSRLYFGPCNKLYKTEIIRQNRIKFPDNISYGEDRIFNYEYIRYVKHIQTLNYSGYHYYKPESGTLTTTYLPNLFELEYSQWQMLNDVYRDKKAFTPEIQQDQFTELFWIIHDNIFANRHQRIKYLHAYIKKLLATPEISDIKRFDDQIKYNRVIKYCILNRKSLLLHSVIPILNLCKK